PAPLVDGEEEAERVHEMRREVEQDAPLAHGLEHQAELVALEVAEAAVNELAGAAARARGQVVFLDDDDREPAARGVACDARAVDAPADDQDVDFAAEAGPHFFT